MISTHIFVATAVAAGAIAFALMAPVRLVVLLAFTLAAALGVLLALGEPAAAQWLRWWRK